MNASALSVEVKQFLNEKISSYEDLQVLLLMRDHAGKRMDAVDVAEYLRIEPLSAAKHLMNLYLRGLLAHGTDHGPYYDFVYAPYIEVGEERISAVALAFERARTEVVDYLLSRGQLQSFADAFKLKKDK